MNEKRFERRDFLKFSAALTAASVGGLASCVTPVAPKAPIARRRGTVFITIQDSATSSILRAYDWDTHEAKDFAAPVGLPHAILQHPKELGVVYAIENLGSCARIDLKSGRSSRVDHVETGELFNGHATASRDGAFVFCTQISKKDGASIAIRDAVSLALVDKVRGGEYAAHQVVHLPGSSIIAWGDLNSPKGGFGGGITFYDYQARKVVARVPLADPILHLVPISNTDVMGLGFPIASKAYLEPGMFERSSRENQLAILPPQDVRPAPLYHVGVDGKSRRLFDEGRKDLFKFNFGLTSPGKSERFLSGHVMSNKVIVWKGSRIERVLDVQAPRNIAVSDDASEFMVLSLAGVEIFSLETFEKLRTITSEKPISSISGYKGIDLT